MARIKLKDFCQTKGFNMVSPVRENVNGFKYVTLLHSDDPGNPENLYLGRRYADEVKVGDRLPLADLYVTEVENSQGESRFKLTDKNGDAAATLAANGYDMI